MKKLFKKSSGEEHDFWISYTDLMSGFLIVFIIVSIITMMTNRRLSDKIPQGEHVSLNNLEARVDTNRYVINDGFYIKSEGDTLSIRINSMDVFRDSTDILMDSLSIHNDSLTRELDSLKKVNQQMTRELDSINGNMDMQNLIKAYKKLFPNSSGKGVVKGKVRVVVAEDKGSIVLYHKDVNGMLFESGEAYPLPALTDFLDQYGRAIVSKTMQLKNTYPNIELRIEGHTDPKGRKGDVYGGDDSFVYNMELSSHRANEVYTYLYELYSEDDSPERIFLRNHAISVGYSFSDRIKEGSHNKRDNVKDNASRRIEFRIIAK